MQTSELQLRRISKEIIQRAEEAVVTEKGLPKVVDDYFVQYLKQDELHHAEVDASLYEGLRHVVKAEVLPLYEQYRLATAKFRERKQNRRLWQYVLGTVGILQLIEAVLTRGRSIAPGVLIPTAILHTFLGFIIYAAAQYVDELQIGRARKRLEKSIEALEGKVRTDVDYDHLRQLLDTDILRAEAVEILAHYDQPRDFWRDYSRVRETDPTAPSELKSLKIPAFERFLKFHVDGQYSSVARQQRFDRLFIEAHEVLLNRDRENYVKDHLKSLKGVA